MAHPQHVTLVITHRLAPGNEQAYEAWLNRIMPDAAGFTGHLGVNVIRPAGDEQAYTVLVRFDNLDNLYRWIHLAAAQAIHRRSHPAAAGERPYRDPPRRGVLVYPAQPRRAPAAPVEAVHHHPAGDLPFHQSGALVLGLVLPQLDGTLLGHFLNDATVVALVVYLWMPIVTRVFHQWLTRR